MTRRQARFAGPQRSARRGRFGRLPGRVLVAALALAAATPPAGAELYRYVDEQGRVHYVDDPAKVPRAARSEPVEPAAPAATYQAPAPPDAGRARRAGVPGSSAGEGSAAAEGTCRFAFSERTRSQEDGEYVYRGRIRNVGRGRASGVRARLVDVDASGRELGAVEGDVEPRTLGPSQAGRFEIRVPVDDRSDAKDQRRFAQSRFEGVASRCEPVDPR